MNRSDESPHGQQSLLRSFRVAWDGLASAMRSDRNLRIHLAATVIVAAVGAWCRISALEWAVIALAIGLVWTAELLNTALESAVDLASPEHHELARRAKDVASAAVLLAAMTAVVVGLVVFGPRLMKTMTASSSVEPESGMTSLGSVSPHLGSDPFRRTFECAAKRRARVSVLHRGKCPAADGSSGQMFAPACCSTSAGVTLSDDIPARPSRRRVLHR